MTLMLESPIWDQSNARRVTIIDGTTTRKFTVTYTGPYTPPYTHVGSLTQ